MSRIQGLINAHRLIVALQYELEAEHIRTPMTILGRPRRRHHEIMGANQALMELGQRILEKARDIRTQPSEPIKD